MAFQGLELTTGQIILLILVLLWSIPWKGYALWLAARKGDRKWFIALLVVNTVGLLEIFYIFYFSKRKKKGELGDGNDGFPLSRE